MPVPSISLRAGFRWTEIANQPFVEPTSTLVLTSSSSRFVDIRVFHNVSTPDDPNLPRTCGLLAHLDWAFAGTSSSETILDKDGEVTLARWEHWIDSRVVLGAKPQDDSGQMYTLKDGRTLEKGYMNLTINGKEYSYPYEELWEDLTPDATDPKDSHKVAIVATMEDESREARGMIVRVGQWVQGIITKSGEISVERWRWNDQDKNFMRILKIGRQFLPCLIAFEEKGPSAVGKKVEFDGMNWEVEERYAWE
ncbi:MAG: hypothetical protein M1820_006953 [Bogoriella megaspora]|nr:MAG: hypothetical protein M1820_006953 [Bogoriella megaspora]